MDNNSNNAVSNEETDQNTIDWIEESVKAAKHLNPIKHPQQDLFIADIFDAISLQLDMASMEYPLFALKAGDNRVRRYTQKGFDVVIAPNPLYGMATIHDKDIWVYCISKLMQAIKEKEPISKIVNFTLYDYLITTNRTTSGRDYLRAKDSLDRLASTRITTNIETDTVREARGFGLIDSWRIVEEKDGRMVRVSVTLPEWLFRSIESKSVLTISHDYFRLRKPLDRRIYELARKHCGNNQSWKFDLSTLHQRSGSTASMKEFRKSIKSLAESNQLPDYCVEFDGKKNQVTFIKRVCLKDLTEEIKLEAKDKKPKRKRITEQEAAKLARPGEEWPDLLKRIGSEYHVIFDKNSEHQ
ncbi:replication initiator protein A [Wohlfahrtiimonas chitiniclastica]|uniref:replication initiator protein A n=1 Tax=Wohlfahrtiimonas chitiniclastica TaxID=400946 RepID=UPI0007B6984D|nr:replication initiator protein A [Wohlfahrtiimonas chitiniclastica]KZX37234.1 replication protein [Wohlfahrtiimonas chitiniclastica]OYQ73250.1 RepB family plasmid replication initiator protein [Wohlfahrtiimonas chitiniclastica]